MAIKRNKPKSRAAKGKTLVKKTKSTKAAKKTIKKRAKAGKNKPMKAKVKTKTKTAAKKTSAKKRAKTAVSKGKKTKKLLRVKKNKRKVAKTKPSIKTRQSTVTPLPIKRAVKKPQLRLVKQPQIVEPIVKAKRSMQQETITTEKPDKTSAGFLGIVPYDEKSGEEYMSDKQCEHFRNILLRWKRALMEEVDRTMLHLKDDVINYPDPSDRASQEEEFNLELRARDRERKLIAKIDEALQNIENNEYGYCEACGVEIGIRRLEARPTATLCIDCKTLDEIREKQTYL